MRLLEFQAKRILSEYGLPVPKSVLITSPEDVAELKLPAVLKAQVAIGGRGQAGGIRVVKDMETAKTIVGELFSADIKGHSVQAILAEEKTDLTREIYLAMLIDKRANLPMVMASAAGGIDIEQIVKQNPERIVRKHIDPFIGLQRYTIRHMAKAIGMDDVAGFGATIQQLYSILQKLDATLVEINPLAETAYGLVALDAKMLLDDKAAYRHPNLFATLREEQKKLDKGERTRAEQLAADRGITYVPLDGDIGVIADGAGTGMLTLDMIQHAGGHAANFCEMGGLAHAEIMRQSIEVVLANPQVRALLITLIGGLTRMDEMAGGIVQYLQQNEASVPMVIRMCGTKEEVGKARLHEVGLDTLDDLAHAVQAAVAIAKRE